MQEKEKINVLGKMKSLSTGEYFFLNRFLYKISSIRTTAHLLSQDTGIKMSVVKYGVNEIKVERVK